MARRGRRRGCRGGRGGSDARSLLSKNCTSVAPEQQVIAFCSEEAVVVKQEYLEKEDESDMNADFISVPQKEGTSASLNTTPNLQLPISSRPAQTVAVKAESDISADVSTVAPYIIRIPGGIHSKPSTAAQSVSPHIIRIPGGLHSKPSIGAQSVSPHIIRIPGGRHSKRSTDAQSVSPHIVRKLGGRHSKPSTDAQSVSPHIIRIRGGLHSNPSRPTDTQSLSRSVSPTQAKPSTAATDASLVPPYSRVTRSMLVAQPTLHNTSAIQAKSSTNSVLVLSNSLSTCAEPNVGDDSSRVPPIVSPTQEKSSSYSSPVPMEFLTCANASSPAVASSVSQTFMNPSISSDPEQVMPDVPVSSTVVNQSTCSVVETFNSGLVNASSLPIKENDIETPVILYVSPNVCVAPVKAVSSEDSESPVVVYVSPELPVTVDSGDDDAPLIVYEGPGTNANKTTTSFTNPNTIGTVRTVNNNSTPVDLNVGISSPEEHSCMRVPLIKNEMETPRDEGPSHKVNPTANEDTLPTGNENFKKRPILFPGNEGNNSKKTRYDDESPVKQLNNIVKDLMYIVESQEGSDDHPTFVVSVNIGGEKYIGRGSSKQEGQYAAARVALSMVSQFSPTIKYLSASNASGNSNTCTSDCDKKPVFKCDPSAHDVRNGVHSSGCNNSNSLHFQLRRYGWNMFKTPIHILGMLCPNAQYTVKREYKSQKYIATVSIGGHSFVGCGRKITLAKAAAARVAIRELHGHTLCSLSSIADMPEDKIDMHPSFLADAIAQVVCRKFQEIMANEEVHQKWKTLAGIVMTTDMQNPVVVALGSGTRCIGEDFRSADGTALNDCHAEVISRRCFKEFLYRQLESVAGKEGQDSILQLGSEYVIRKNTQFHLFLSNAPCGDAHVFSHREQFEAIDRHPLDQVRGLLRSKIESGEGTIPIAGKFDNPQNSAGGANENRKLVIMSCSDKLLRWNFCGIQGGLLGYFVNPVYLHSITLGNGFNPGAFRRAMYGRIESAVPHLPNFYRINRPKANTTTVAMTPELSKSPNYSFNWSLGMPSPEIVNGKTGKLMSGEESRLSRHNFALRFASLYRRIPPAKMHRPLERKMHSYSEMKTHNLNYQKAKQAVNDAARETNIGQWASNSELQSGFKVKI